MEMCMKCQVSVFPNKIMIDESENTVPVAILAHSPTSLPNCERFVCLSIFSAFNEKVLCLFFFAKKAGMVPHTQQYISNTFMGRELLGRVYGCL